MNARVLAAEYALGMIHPGQVLGIGTGRAVEALITLLPTIQLPKVIVSSSLRTTQALEKVGIITTPLNEVDQIDLYLDGADQVLESGIAIKGGGGAHTIEKCLANIAKDFVGLVDTSKVVKVLDFPIAVEVLNIARSAIAREIAMHFGQPHYREGFLTDSHNVILDITGISITDPLSLEKNLQQIPGVVAAGVFAKRRFDQLIVGQSSSVAVIEC
ncbi:ribose-5-phosphate isomerase RpiA [Gammaproteobacteria bacterium]|nr:ribose-5-phosphate isomerase RpiA [Gammaproteobacteria bacterium]